MGSPESEKSGLVGLSRFYLALNTGQCAVQENCDVPVPYKPLHKGPCGSFVQCKTGFDPNFAKPSSCHRVDQFGSKWICK